MKNDLDNKMLLLDCINDITQSAINTQIKLVDQYLENFFEDFDLKVDNDGNEYYVPKKLIIKNDYAQTFEISKATLKNNNQLSLKDFNVSGKFRVIPHKNKFMIDFNTNNKINGIDLDISINLGKIDIENKVNDINLMIDDLSNGKKIVVEK